MLNSDQIYSSYVLFSKIMFYLEKLCIIEQTYLAKLSFIKQI